MIIQCCDCKKVRLSGNWRAFHVPVPPTTLISHTYCPDCLAKAMREIDLYHDAHAHVCRETHAA